MFVQLKTGYDTDAGPCWITSVRFSKSWSTAYFHGRALQKVTGTAYANHDANFYDPASNERFWLSGPKRDQTDGRYRHVKPTIDDDVQDAYDAFLRGAPLPGRERG